ncbi:MauE/DoxX family redox-associated membrane protein [Desulfatitalea alkaliphila]|uniref:DoxX family membrane protein n=1 Tax=Desulfatitalea alkaliphila TaxID=2929485 RepID=A0AA41UKD8_9BACT|nr:MauE/DoxX family redox-associated membrane protein [Desulfatitalea alkaliphila]MCJ8501342.1 DoxX family membrane protein [Desulfatitalea alkaliphila]
MARATTYGARFFLGLLWIYASYDKILNPEAFAYAVYNYQVLPDGGINLTALVLPWVELLMGICLLVGFWLPGAALLSTLLLAGFAGALLFNLYRGLDVQCGCFSTQAGGDPAGYPTVLRDLSFLAVSVYLMVMVTFRGSLQNRGERVQHVPRREGGG